MSNELIRAGLSVLFCLQGISTLAIAQDRHLVGPTQAHAHNDYLHERPLLDALEAGFTSVEADVFLVDGQLLVAHTASDIEVSNTLQKLYLDPLRAQVAANGGRVHASLDDADRQFWLLIDIKSNALETYRRLHDVLQSYADILSYVEGDELTLGAIQVVISGNRPQDYIAAQPKRYCGIDGRISDLDSSVPAHLIPMISDNWGNHFSWRGIGPLPPDERQRLQDIVKRSHDKGRVVRFWATPENEQLWQSLVDSKVDWINTDQLQSLSQFLDRQRPSRANAKAKRKF